MIFGICGLAGSGKDTFADGIIKADNSFKKLKMAKFLKDVTAILFGWNREWLDGNTPEQREWREKVDVFWDSKVQESLRPFTPRKALQFIGTELFRKQVSPSFWVYVTEQFILNNPGNYIIPDCRFPEELEMVNRLGGINIEVCRNVPEWYEYVKDCHSKNISIDDKQITGLHESETSWIGNTNISQTIYNDSTIEELYKKASSLYYLTTCI